MEETRKKVNRRGLIASCPVCGNALFRGAYSDIEIRCGKCRTDLKVELNWNKIAGFSYKITSIGEAETAAPA